MGCVQSLDRDDGAMEVRQVSRSGGERRFGGGGGGREIAQGQRLGDWTLALLTSGGKVGERAEDGKEKKFRTRDLAALYSGLPSVCGFAL